MDRDGKTNGQTKTLKYIQRYKYTFLLSHRLSTQCHTHRLSDKRRDGQTDRQTNKNTEVTTITKYKKNDIKHQQLPPASRTIKVLQIKLRKNYRDTKSSQQDGRANKNG